MESDITACQFQPEVIESSVLTFYVKKPVFPEVVVCCCISYLFFFSIKEGRNIPE